MKVLLATTILFVYHASATYAPGQTCRTNKECEAGCAGAEWTIGPKAGGGFELECDTPETDPTYFYSVKCLLPPLLPLAAPFQKDFPGTAKACATLQGRDCVASCVVSGQSSEDAATRQKWKGACSTGLVEIREHEYDGEAQQRAEVSMVA